MPCVKNMEAFDGRADWLVKHHNGKYVIFHEATFVDSFDTFDAAAQAAIRRFGQDYLIRQGWAPARVPGTLLPSPTVQFAPLLTQDFGGRMGCLTGVSCSNTALPSPFRYRTTVRILMLLPALDRRRNPLAPML